MFSVISLSCVAPKYHRADNVENGEKLGPRFCHSASLGLDWLTVAAFALVTVFGAQIGLPPAAQFIVFGAGCTYALFTLGFTALRIKADCCPNSFLCGDPDKLY